MSDEQESINVPKAQFQIPMHMYGSNIVMLTDPKSALYKLELNYRGLMETSDKQIIQVGKPLMNDQGISAVLGINQALINQITILSNINKQDVVALMNFTNDTICRELMMNRITYNIESFSARDKIYYMSMSLCYVTLKRALEGDDKRFWKGTVQEINTNVTQQEKNKGFMAGLNPFAK
jgi:hypothetical protein